MATNPQIATVLIPCYVVQKNNQVFILNDNIVGQVLQVPCRNVIIDDVAYWATPVKDYQVFTNLYYTPVIAPITGAPVPIPTYDSFLVIRVRDKLSDDIWWIYVQNVVSTNDFINSCETCCGNSAVPMPLTTGNEVLEIAPCDLLCTYVNSKGQYYSTWALPYLPTGFTYFIYGALNNAPLTPAPAHGFPTPALLLNFLNAAWSNTGSPNSNLVWSLSPDSITLTVTETGVGAVGSDTICVAILAINPSQ